ncbi:hypothetical protein BO86DRAFT_385119 [Aspergillus japonicus CBS 114.51]|uniref:SWIM-type domain-containing protein n=2 Tax=Aspergillus TaxID=5052 RepID=A0A2V5H8G2_ASPV1|nr:hypothetical protein BO86DRAFT_385119 [Aspergillus japonicus CBS 114.51]PYI20615.1 hypothetical protein BO99DRAFT_442192 [Aspergillus violaceofuscus CBS 115571]RAH87126.1 hypothetical protein BO86DRAFT_385119 [Aspergillus japonicus CBS 114.51]
MSTPTRQLRRLSITGDMPTVRPRKEIVRSQAEDSDDSDGSDGGSDSSADETATPTAHSVVHGASGLSYDLSRLSFGFKARALVGLTSHFDVIRCQETQTGYGFQLSERPHVHLGAESFTCTCSTYSSQLSVPCQHIYWLHDQLHGRLFSRPPTPDIPLSNHDRLPNLGRIRQLLDSKIPTIAHESDWPYSPFEAHGGMNRQEMVRDIMSAFDSAILPEDFRPDLAGDEPGQARTPEQCVVQGDFAATLFRLAVHDDAVYASLRKAMPIGACTAIYFDKVQQRLRSLLAGFDRYCQTGQLPTGVRVLTARTVLEEIHGHVHRIQRSIVARAPHGADGAAKALVTLLEDICGRNRDPLEGNTWGRETFDGEDEDRRNLYHQLVGRTNETGDFFVLDVLEQLPLQDLRQFEEKLKGVLRKVEVDRAPKAYIIRLDALIRALASTDAGAGQKRPSSATTTGNSKRAR